MAVFTGLDAKWSDMINFGEFAIRKSCFTGVTRLTGLLVNGDCISRLELRCFVSPPLALGDAVLVATRTGRGDLAGEFCRDF